jgi:hypothetical protein
MHCSLRGKLIPIMDEEKKTGQPLGDPGNRGGGNARPPGAGQEGGLGSYGDQRQDEVLQRDTEDDAPPLDGTIRKQDVEGDVDEKRPAPGASLESLWDGPRLSMEARKRQPLIIW